MAERWSDLHRRLHQQLLQQRDLLPDGEPLLLAVSGGQDSMALVGLLSDLRRLHHWPLQLWHGNHGWRPDAAQQARELQAWAQEQGLAIAIDHWSSPQADEASARAWRYGQLEALAQRLGCRRVVTGHTASDRSETVLLQLARGSHRRGLTSLRPRRILSGTIELGGVAAAERQQGTHQLGRAAEAPPRPEAGEAAAMAAPGELEQNRLAAVARRVAGHHPAASQPLGQGLELPVAPGAGRGFIRLGAAPVVDRDR